MLESEAAELCALKAASDYKRESDEQCKSLIADFEAYFDVFVGAIFDNIVA